ncbi:probable protein ABIL5 [Sesamum indicum]|uniref:Probable protein ABIL5 n=1 Tax=Sesamum indicum TaxID=4182 RepID=A0A6I9TCK6_SESIN|nr:probable protein ABIL5 [Sesamum indicum]
MEKTRRIQQEDSSICLVDNAKELEKCVQELRNFSSQLYHAADYCETSFLNTQDKTIVVETTKEYISRAVATVVDHLGGISANLEYSLRNSDSIPQTEHKIDMLKLRIGTWQQQSHKLALERFYLTADFSRHHCRYILPPSKDSETKNVESRCTKDEVEAENEKRNEFETEEPLFLHTYNCKPSSQVENSKMDRVKNKEFLPAVVPVHDRLAILPKAEQSRFQFQGAHRQKPNMISWKVMQNKDITSLIRRRKQILT